jgi:hypothetical protein
LADIRDKIRFPYAVIYDCIIGEVINFLQESAGHQSGNTGTAAFFKDKLIFARMSVHVDSHDNGAFFADGVVPEN